MKYSYLILGFITALTYACGNNVRQPVKPAITRDSLVYSYKTLKQRATDCGSKPDSGCTVIKIIYPEFKNAPRLNDTVRLRSVKYFGFESPADTAFKVLAANVIRSYQNDVKKYPNPGMFYSIDTKTTVIRQDSNLTTLQINGYAYLGGAHGNTSINFLNWDTRTNKPLNLDDILTPGYLPKLNTVAEKIFRKNENLSDTASLARDYFFKDAKFSVNKNFLITPLGLRFLYNTYEIKPFAAGTTDLFIPYNKIKGFLKPKTVTAQYLH